MLLLQSWRVSRPAHYRWFSFKGVHEENEPDVNLLKTDIYLLNLGIAADDYLSFTCCLSIYNIRLFFRIPYMNNISLNWITLQPPLCFTLQKKKSTPFKQALNLQYRAALRRRLCAPICRHYPWTRDLVVALHTTWPLPRIDLTQTLYAQMPGVCLREKPGRCSVVRTPL